MPLIGGIIAAGVGQALGGAIKNSIANAVEKVAKDKKTPEVKAADAAPVAEAVIDALGKDKVFVNATNSEMWWQSGVALGLSGTQIGALAIVAPQIIEHTYHLGQYDMAAFLPAMLIVVSGVFGLIRRFVPGFKPLFS